MPKSDYVDATEAMELLGVSKSWFYVNRDKIKSRKRGDTTYLEYSRESVVQMKEKRRLAEGAKDLLDVEPKKPSPKPRKSKRAAAGEPVVALVHQPTATPPREGLTDVDHCIRVVFRSARADKISADAALDMLGELLGVEA